MDEDRDHYQEWADEELLKEDPESFRNISPFFTVMNTQEHLLVCTVEEGVEIAEEANTLSRNLSKIGTKCLRFGLDDRNTLDPTGPTNRERLVAELIDLFALTEMMVEAGMIPDMWLDPKKVDEKKAKVRKFMDHARKCGALSSVNA